MNYTGTKVKVTQEHIGTGTKVNPHYCMLSLSIQSALGMSEGVAVLPGRGGINGVVRIGTFYYKLPMPASYSAYTWDRGETVEPFEFEIGELIEN